MYRWITLKLVLGLTGCSSFFTAMNLRSLCRWFDFCLIHSDVFVQVRFYYILSYSLYLSTTKTVNALNFLLISQKLSVGSHVWPFTLRWVGFYFMFLQSNAFPSVSEMKYWMFAYDLHIWNLCAFVLIQFAIIVYYLMFMCFYLPKNTCCSPSNAVKIIRILILRNLT